MIWALPPAELPCEVADWAPPPPAVPDEDPDTAWIPEGAIFDEQRRGFPVRRNHHGGIGLVTGTFVTGMSVKVMVDPDDAIQFEAGLGGGPFTYWPAPGLGLGIDYLHHLPMLFEDAPVRFGWHLGLGTSLRLRPEAREFERPLSFAVGLHAVLGVELLLRDAPVDVSMAWRPGAIGGLGRARGVAFAYGDLAIHVRFWFDTRDLQEDLLAE